jgi:hypothetical protein
VGDFNQIRANPRVHFEKQGEEEVGYLEDLIHGEI